jgi:hypothetical protein
LTFLGINPNPIGGNETDRGNINKIDRDEDISMPRTHRDCSLHIEKAIGKKKY